MQPRVVPLEALMSTIYRVDLSTSAWLRELLCLDPFDGAIGHIACAFEHRGPVRGWTLVDEQTDGTGTPFHALSCRPILAAAGTNEHLFPPGDRLCGSQSELLGDPVPEPWNSYFARTRTRDIWSMFAAAPDRTVVSLSTLLASPARTPPRSARFWSSVAIHVTTAHRLRRALERRDEAIVAPDGKLLHAEGTAREEANREALRRAARAIDRAKTKKTDPLAAIESWKALVSGRWSLVDEFESDGRRFLVARVNEPKLPRKLDLTGRERHIAALAALGRSNKEIAYELGLATSSVASYLGRLRRKHGLRRSDLIR